MLSLFSAGSCCWGTLTEGSVPLWYGPPLGGRIVDVNLAGYAMEDSLGSHGSATPWLLGALGGGSLWNRPTGARRASEHVDQEPRATTFLPSILLDVVRPGNPRLQKLGHIVQASGPRQSDIQSSRLPLLQPQLAYAAPNRYRWPSNSPLLFRAAHSCGRAVPQSSRLSRRPADSRRSPCS